MKKQKIDDLENFKIMQNFTIENIPDLDVCVLGALELFNREKIPKINLPYKRPMVVGSGNAEATGRIIFNDHDSVFASESDFERKLKSIKNIDGVVLVSASGSKHAPIIAKCAGKYKKHVTLLTNKDNSETDKYLDHKHKYDEYVFPRQKEPYTYNTSTYMGMILGKTHEKPSEIYSFIKNKIDKIKMPNFRKWDNYYLIVPTKFSTGIIRMFNVKFIELFGRMVSRDVETSEYVKHATTVVPSCELFISFGEENKIWGEKKNRLHIPLPKNVDFAGIMAIGYYVIGKIQKSHPCYFKDNIVNYTNHASKVFGSEINAIVG